MTKAQNNKIDKEIKSGKYREQYLVYNRKSTDDSDNQKNSIGYQKSANLNLAKVNLLPIAQFSLKGFCVEGMISEKHSGFKEDDVIQFTDDGMVQYKIERPKFQQLVRLVNDGYFKGIICLCWDRLSRNRGDDTVIRKLMRKGVDVRFAYANYDNTSSGALHMDIDGMFAQHHSRVTSEKVTLATRNLRNQGVCTYRAPIGYLNTGDMHNKPFDPDRAPVIKRMFKLYATGDWTLHDLARWANEQGLTTIPMRRRRTEEELLAEEDEEIAIEKVSRSITYNHIHKIITNPFYTGKILNTDGTYISSTSHSALVSNVRFSEVQSMLHKKKVSLRHPEKLNLHLRGMIRCGDCTRAACPYMKKGKQYFGLRCREGCINTIKSFSLAFIEEKLGEYIASLSFTKEEQLALQVHIGADIARLENTRLENLAIDESHKKKLKADLKYLRTEKLTLLKTGVYTPKAFLAEEDRLSIEIRELIAEEDTSEAAMHAVIKDVLKLSELLKDKRQYYEKAHSQEKERAIRIIFSELTISENTLSFKCTKGIQPLENRFKVVCDPNTWLSELMHTKYQIEDCIQEFKTFGKSDEY